MVGGGEQETQPFEISGRICGILNGLYDGADFTDILARTGISALCI